MLWKYCWKGGQTLRLWMGWVERLNQRVNRYCNLLVARCMDSILLTSLYYAAYNNNVLCSIALYSNALYFTLIRWSEAVLSVCIIISCHIMSPSRKILLHHTSWLAHHNSSLAMSRLWASINEEATENRVSSSSCNHALLIPPIVRKLGPQPTWRAIL